MSAIGVNTLDRDSSGNGLFQLEKHQYHRCRFCMHPTSKHPLRHPLSVHQGSSLHLALT